MKIVSFFSMLLSASYSMSSHPVLLMVIILTQAVIVCLISWMKLKTSWMAYILFLIFLGGLMVLFIYITSLASNELVTMKLMTFSMVAPLFLTASIYYILSMNSQLSINEATMNFKIIMYSYSWGAMILILSTMVYLLLTLIVVVKISNKFEAPIKNTIF